MSRIWQVSRRIPNGTLGVFIPGVTMRQKTDTSARSLRESRRRDARSCVVFLSWREVRYKSETREPRDSDERRDARGWSGARVLSMRCRRKSPASSSTGAGRASRDVVEGVAGSPWEVVFRANLGAARCANSSEREANLRETRDLRQSRRKARGSYANQRKARAPKRSQREARSSHEWRQVGRKVRNLERNRRAARSPYIWRKVDDLERNQREVHNLERTRREARSSCESAQLVTKPARGAQFVWDIQRKAQLKPRDVMLARGAQPDDASARSPLRERVTGVKKHEKGDEERKVGSENVAQKGKGAGS
ncbi:hypothetical protein B0H19DRAFT_1066701 [Mycena capillaripes]|nr:hypothetical protein B0H19DRAFT_1066701 [Mycena capillaripes]